MLPIVRRELQVAARSKGLYWQRLLVGGVASAVALSSIVFSSTAANRAGANMFTTLAWAVFTICLLDAVRCAGDTISWERREGTLGLLFLTDLRGFDVVLGKFSSAAIKVFTTLLVTFPILALPLMMGGITFGVWARSILSLIVAVLFALSTAMLFSSFSRGALASMGGTIAALLFSIGCPAMFAGAFSAPGAIWLAGPLGMMVGSDPMQYGTRPGVFWAATVFSLSVALVMLVGSCFLVSRRGSFEASQKKETWWKRLLQPKQDLKSTWSEGSLIDQPALWLAKRTLPGRRLLWILTVIGAAICALVGAFAPSVGAMVTIGSVQVGMAFLLKLWLGALAPQSLHAARASGALELLLCTPLRPENLIRGQMEALRSYVFPPALVICLGFPIIGIFGAMLGMQKMDDFGPLFFLIVWGVLWFVLFLLDFFALSYSGLWFALNSIKIEQAVGKNIGLVLIVPWLTMVIPILGMFGLFLWPIFWLSWSSYNMNRYFSDRAAERVVAPRV